MTANKSDIVTLIRTAIDDILPTGMSDSFTANTDSELWQATCQAVDALLLELPLNLLDASVEILTGASDENRGMSCGNLPEDFLRFVSLDINGCAGVLWELTEPGSDAERMQRSAWSRGTSTKPKAMIDNDVNGNRMMAWWPGGNGHDSAQLSYIQTATVTPANPNADPQTEANIECAIRNEAERLVIYRAASIFFEGKKETETAEKFAAMSVVP